MKAAQAAVESLKVAEIKMSSGQQHYLHLLPQDRAAFEDFQPPKARITRRSAIVAGGLGLRLPNHAIVDRGRLIGLWEYDPAAESIAWMSFVKGDLVLGEAITRTEDFVREQLGDAGSFSPDSSRSRAPRIAALRAAAATA